MDMKTLLEHMQAHHGRCDQLYADGENFLLDEKIGDPSKFVEIHT